VYGGGNAGVGVTTGAPKVYLVFWGSQWGSQSTNAQGYLTLSGDPSGMAPALQGLMKGLGTGSETWSGVMTQYCEGVAAGAQVCPASAPHVGYPIGGALAGVWADTTAAAPASATGHQLATEAVNAANHFGITTQAANRNTQYVIVSPSGTTPDGFNTPNGAFCAWHDFSGDPSLPGGGAASASYMVAFTNLPYVTDAGGSCGANYINPGAAGLTDGVTIVGGHEYAETITDQFPNGGWLDSTANQNENADKCAWIATGQGASQDVTLTTGTFAMQSTWANDFNGGTGGCEISHPINGAAPPAITSAAGVTFTVGIAGSFPVTTTGTPGATVSESGALPAGVTFNGATATLSGTPAQGTVGSYTVTFTASNGSGTNATQSFTLTVNQAVLTYPTDGATNVDTTQPFTWSTIPQAQGYILVVGTTVFGTDLLNSGVLPSTQSSFAVPAFPSGPPLHATLLTKVGGAWGTYEAITFTAAPGEATFTSPQDGQTGVDPTKPFTWSTIPKAQGYLLAVGTTRYGTDLALSGVLPATQSSFATPVLPANRTLYASLLTEVNGAWSRQQSIAFTTGSVGATFTAPLNGQTGVATPLTFTWTPVASAQAFSLALGSAPFGTDLVNTGVLTPGQTSFTSPALPHGKTVYATLLTFVGGTWVYQAISFSTS
jgi:serine protease